MEEAEREDLKSYQNLGELFRRRLRPGAREICSLCPLVSPCDGKVLHWGEVEAGGRVEQVKGVSYLLGSCHYISSAEGCTFGGFRGDIFSSTGCLK